MCDFFLYLCTEIENMFYYTTINYHEKDLYASCSYDALHADDAQCHPGAKVAWPAGEIDENAGRYLDFAVTAPEAMDVRITGISMDLAAHSTSTMCYHVNTGFGEGFTDVQTIDEKVNMTNLTIQHLSLTPTLTIPAGETLHVRILPWHNLGEAKSGKYICVKNVVISGQAFEAQPGEGVEYIQQPTVGSQKIMRDGQLLILRDGKIYNAVGQELK